MNWQKIIRKLTAGFLLIVFALSITPKLLIHGLFANHEDRHTLTTKTDSKFPQLHKDGINCQCLDLVVENPYTEITYNNFPSPENHYAEKHVLLNSVLYSVEHEFHSLRGPPVLI